nr:LOB domain-containing protein 16-like [Ipomoea batatas]
MASSGVGSPCGACKFLRRRCAPDCVFAPYFCSDDGPVIFAAIHKVFGASNVSKLLLQLPVHRRFPAVFSIGIEAQARMEDPIYGCVSHIIALQQQNSVDGGFWAPEMEAVSFPAEERSMQRASPSDVGELQALALRMTKPEPS